MSQTTIRTLCRAFAAAALAAASLLAVPAVGRAQEVVALVDGEPITALDIEQRAKFIQMSTQKAPARKEVLDGLIDEILEIREAKRFGINVPDSEVDNAFANVGSRMGADPAKLTQMLAKGGASAETLKHRLKAELAWNALVKGRFKSSLEIADSDVEAQLDLHKPEDKNEVGYEYVLRPVLFVVPRGSPDAAFEARKKDADALRVRFAELRRGDSVRARVTGGRGARSGHQVLRRPAASLARHPRQDRSRSFDAAGADRRRHTGICAMLQKGKQDGHTGAQRSPR